ncbi:MAG: hypothetical protein ACFB0C_07950 [Leptolyngbyaceae cyanobacterium]
MPGAQPMPIIKARYPDNWPDIAAQVKQGANWCCQQCQRPGRQPGEAMEDFLKRINAWRQRHTPQPPKYEDAPRRYLLTVAHLDQCPGNQAPENLKALCTVCYLRFDRPYCAKQQRLRAEFYGQLSIDDAWPEGLQLSLMPGQVSPFSVPRQGEAPMEGRKAD